jgi:putative membrane protein
MDTPSKIEKASLSDFLAAERTFLAWIRTGLALMGFGFVVARFGLFLEEFHAALPNATPPVSHRFSLLTGTALILVGVTVNLYSGWQHVHLVAALNRGEAGTHTSKLALIVALVLAVFGLAMAVYLTLLRETG